MKHNMMYFVTPKHKFGHALEGDNAPCQWTSITDLNLLVYLFSWIGLHFNDIVITVTNNSLLVASMI